ncbi:response regulator [Salana multivorans]|uniref:response regulator n=1 Tax=Salana multivorans TaxID=120377 RepID=UPI000ADB0406|nr:response regulator transcription factor [Salana multivorans]
MSAPGADPTRPGGAAEEGTRPVRVVVVDDQATIRLGLRLILDHDPGIDVVGEAGDGRAAVDVVRRERPDVVLMDVRMPRMSGIEAIEVLTADAELARVRALVLTTFDDEDYLVGALAAGASGFLLKDAEPAELLTAVRRVAAGDSVLDPAVTHRVVTGYVAARRACPAVDPRLALLSPRELEVLDAVTRGLSNLEIGRELFCSEATVKSHVRSLLTKLDLVNRVQLVVFAYSSGLVTP